MTTQYEDTTDTTGAGGYPGPQPLGTGREVTHDDTTSDGDGSARFGGGPYADPAPVVQEDTTGTNGEGTFRDPTFTGYTNTVDLMYGVGPVRNDYKPPMDVVPASILDTTLTDVTGVGYDQDEPGQMFWMYQNQDVYTVGAGAPGLADTEDITMATLGVALTETTILRGSIQIFSNGGATTERTDSLVASTDGPTRLRYSGIIGALTSVNVDGNVAVPGDEDVTLTNDEQPVQLVQTGISSDLEDIVVTYDDGGGAVTLTNGADYTLSESGTGLTRTVSIAWVSGGALPLGTETVNAAYEYLEQDLALVEDTDYTVAYFGTLENRYAEITLIDGGAVGDNTALSVVYNTGDLASFRPVFLSEGIDYTLEYDGDIITVFPMEDSELGDDGSLVTVHYLYGTPQFLHSREPLVRPDAPTGVQAIKANHFVEVYWEAPAAGDKVEGYLIEGARGSQMYVAASERKVVVPFLEPDRENNQHDTLGPETDFGTYEDYVFRVMAVNRRGTSDPSDWSTPPTSPTNYELNPPSNIPYENRINPIYRADGTIVPGTGIGIGVPV